MRLFTVLLLIALSLAGLNALDIEVTEESFSISGDSFSYDFSPSLLYFRSPHLSYGRLDSLSIYSTLFNPYRRYHYSGLSVSDSSSRGLRGILLSFGDFKGALSIGKEKSGALFYDGKYIDASLVYYDRGRSGGGGIINNFRRSMKRDIYALSLRFSYKSYIDLMAVLSYSPYLGPDGFYRLNLSYGRLSLILSYGNTLLSDESGLFSVRASLSSYHLDFSFNLKYDEQSLYTDFFRSYSSGYYLRLKLGNLSLSHNVSFSFSSLAEVRRSGLISISYRNVRASITDDGRLFFSVRAFPLSIGVDSEGAYVTFKVTRNIELSLDQGRLGIRFTLSV